MSTLTSLVERHGVDVLDHLDRNALVPILGGLQVQGDVIVIPTPDKTLKRGASVPPQGVAVVRGENGGNTHLLLS